MANGTDHVGKDAAPVTKRLSIRGRVQGVGFRVSFVAQARAHGIAGWVRNRHDGSVEALVQAPSERALEPLLAWAHRGPSAARVDAVRIEDLSVTGESRSHPGMGLPERFETRPTA